MCTTLNFPHGNVQITRTKAEKSGRSYLILLSWSFTPVLGEKKWRRRAGKKFSFANLEEKARGGKIALSGKEEEEDTHKKQKKRKGKILTARMEEKAETRESFSYKKRPPPDRQKLTNIVFSPKKRWK